MDENKDSYWNTEDNDCIVCPYCGEDYKPSAYGYAHIGGERVDCYTEREQECTCDVCGKRFKMVGHQTGWKYFTETISGEVTKQEADDNGWF